ncbi:MAG: ribonuclease H-like domain-containing protein [Candidatus Brennerbacteria bacterium]|nr:ribonuclease H-like domain-containing protein [Candidatus Brennerbacteria bacterium]
MINKFVFDIETKDTFEEVGGQENLKELHISVVGVYSYADDAYRAYEEYEFSALADAFRRAHLLIGFSSKRFDLPILQKYVNFPLAPIPHFDILEAIEKSFGRRVGLGILAEANLGVGKTAHGLQAIEFYRNGEMQKLKDYCLQDVKITKELYDLMQRQGYLWVPQRNSSQMAKVALSFAEPAPPPANLFS